MGQPIYPQLNKTSFTLKQNRSQKYTISSQSDDVNKIKAVDKTVIKKSHVPIKIQGHPSQQDKFAICRLLSNNHAIHK